MKRFSLSSLVLGALAASLFLFAGNGLAQTNSALADLLSQLKSNSTNSGDTLLQSLGNELGSKVKALNKSLAGSPESQAQLNTALHALLGNQGGESLAALQKLSAARLTPEQTKLAKDVTQVGSAYLVQKNFASLEGSQSDVAQMVNSLRKGNYTDALPAVQKISQNAKLTTEQKDLLASVANQLAPAASKVGGALKGLKSLPGLGK